ncbi:MAG: phosphoglucosamine mutase [Pseudomonadota bacterium]|nr:phosphoglucosamine mutase [Pseudomonadota bacterium]MEC8712539.1 phosphoglucosamine mutase [Pseudomonadota bacterium]
MAGMFGTDGVRARVNTGAMTAEAVVRLALASGRWFIDNNPEGRAGRPLVVIGKDPRVSGYMIEAALVAGFTSIGMDCRLLGPMPTPGVAYLTQSLRAHLGVMISASHNPYYDNGIKQFGPDGFKLDDAIEIGISELAAGSIGLSAPEALGRASRMLDSVGRYVEFAKSTLASEVRFDGMKVVVDCANGAAYRTAPDTLRDLGAEVIAIANDPDGFNINQDCGAVHPQTLAATVLAHGADVGVALDGDADRLILVDETGTEINGDQVLACLAREMQSRGTLSGNAVVGTVMTNGGIEPFLSGLGLQIHRTAVGDRYVLERMRQEGLNLGGESSGHILMTSLSTSGDWLIAALQMLHLLSKNEQPASKLFHAFVPRAQKLVNLEGIDPAILTLAPVVDQLAAIEAKAADGARILVRPSGTQSLIRVMVEADDEATLDAIMQGIILLIETEAKKAE